MFNLPSYLVLMYHLKIKFGNILIIKLLLNILNEPCSFRYQ